MPRYDYLCPVCGPLEVYYALRDYPGDRTQCRSCGAHMVRQYLSAPSLHCHDPYIDEDITGEPIEITSPAHRDRVLAENGLSMDSARYVQRKRDNWEDGVSAEEVISKAKEHYAAKKQGKAAEVFEERPELPTIEESAKV